LIKIAVDLGIFEKLVKKASPLSLQKRSESTGSEYALLGRIMRALAAIHAVEETEVGRYEASKLSRAFASPKGIAGSRLL
jgi:hypothetical protein